MKKTVLTLWQRGNNRQGEGNVVEVECKTHTLALYVQNVHIITHQLALKYRQICPKLIRPNHRG